MLDLGSLGLSEMNVAPYLSLGESQDTNKGSDVSRFLFSTRWTLSSDTDRSWTISRWVRLQNPPRDLQMDKAVKERMK